MYKISVLGNNGYVTLYDQTDALNGYPVTDPQCTLEIGQPGNLKFALLQSHSLYDSIKTFETYIKAELDDDEFFYGRVIDVNIEETTGVKEVQCAGSLSFLDDIEIAPPANGSASMTGEEFFRSCITQYNAGIDGDTKRAISVGTISATKASVTKTFSFSTYTKTKQALDNYLINEYGGYLRIRKSGNVHVIDWIEEFNAPNDSPIELTNNVVSQQNASSSNDMFTMLRPTGKNGIELPEGTVAVDASLVAKYGKIVRGIKFSNASTVEQLRSETTNYLSLIGKGLEKTCTVKMIDMRFMDESVDLISLGAKYTNIQGFEGEEMTVFGTDRHFDNPAEDTVTLKNKSAMTSKRTSSAGGKVSSRGSSAQAFANIYHHITETEDTLSIHADEISLHGVRIEETAAEFERYSTETTATLQDLGQDIRFIQGTAVYQNSDHITQVAGAYTVRYRQVPAARVEGKNPQDAGYYVWDAGYIVQEADIGSGIELYATLNNALIGNAVNTNTISAGQIYGRMVKTTHTTPYPGTTYYTRNLGVGRGTEVYIDEEGQEVNVAYSIITTSDRVSTVEGSALWTKRDDITGVVGEFDIVTDPTTGVRRLVVKSGGGMKIKRDNVEYGLYDDGNLTGGIVAQKLGDGTVFTAISGDIIDITTNDDFSRLVLDHEGLVHTVGDNTTSISTLSNTVDGMSSTVTGLNGQVSTLTNTVNGLSSTVTSLDGQVSTLSNTVDGFEAKLEGVVDQNGNVTAASIATAINDQSQAGVKIQGEWIVLDGDAVASSLSGKNINAGEIYSTRLDADNISIQDAFIGNLDVAGIQINLGGGITYDISNPITSASVDSTTNTLTLYYADGTEAVNFSKAVVTSLSGVWTNGVYKVTPTGSTTPKKEIGFASGIDVPLGIQTNGTPTSYSSNDKYIVAPLKVVEEQPNQSPVTRHTFDLTINATAAWNAGSTAGKNVVTIIKGSWSNGRITFSKSEGTASTKGVALSNPGGSWSNGTYSVTLNDAYDSSNPVSTGYSVNVSLPSITVFDTTHAPTDITVSGHTNNSSGYQLESSGASGTAYIVVKGTIQEGGSTRYAYSYLSSAPTNLYRKGYSDGNTAGITSGKNAVTITKGSWSNGRITFSKSEGTASTKGVILSNPGGSWSSGTYTTTLKDAYDANNPVSTGYSVSVSLPEITYFDTTHAPTDITVGGHTNNSDGYEISSTGSSGTAYIVVKGTIQEGGSTRYAYSYVGAAPTALYRKAYSDGYSASLPSDIAVGDGWRTDSISDSTLVSWLSTSNFWTANAFKNNYGYAKFGVSTHGKTKYFYFSFDNRKLSSGGNPAYGEGYTAGVAYGEVVTGFGTSAPEGQTYGNYVNNSSGYYQISTGSSGEVVIVTRGRINTHNSTTNQYMTDYLYAAPTAVYRKGYSDGAASASGSINVQTSSTSSYSGLTLGPVGTKPGSAYTQIFSSPAMKMRYYRFEVQVRSDLYKAYYIDRDALS